MSNMLYSVIVLLFATNVYAFVKSPSVAFKWKNVDFAFSSDNDRNDAINQGRFIPKNNLPLGLEIYGDRIFITVPRWKEGVAASLTYIKMTDPTDSPVLRPYPNWEAHNQNVSEPEIVSPFRMRADKCGRLWVLDTGKVEILSKKPDKDKKPKLLIFDLKTDKLIHSYTIPDDQHNNPSFFANIVLEENGCDDIFAYLADLKNPALVVYDYKNNKSWMFKNDYFEIDNNARNFNVSGLSFQWRDGLFGLAISGKDAEGYSTLYFHPMVSFQEFKVSTKILRNESLANNQTAAKEFKLLGNRGPKSQSGASFLHQKTGVLFYALFQQNAVGCWKTSLQNYTEESQGKVMQDDEVVAFPSDLKVDDNDNLWVTTDNLPLFMFSTLNYDKYYFGIIKATVKEAIKETPCDS